VADYKDITLPVSKEEVRVHRVPESWVNSVVPSRPRPRRPEVAMKTATGEQRRPAKGGEAEYEAWLVEKEEWEQERDELQEAVRLCLALREYPIPDPLEFPSHIQDLIDDGLVQLPEDDRAGSYMLEAMWLKAVPLAAMVDEMEVHYTIQLLGGISEEAIDQMKNSFRNSVLGQATAAMGAGAEEPANGREPEADVQV
jgi:hypothetical protein